jgi:hypothetical protein
MTNPSDAADAYLTARFNTGLEQALLDITGGYPSTVSAALTDVSFERFDVRHHPDGGVSEGYAGRLTLQDVAYIWRAWTYRNTDGSRFMTDLSEFSPVSWQAGIRIGGLAG